MLVVAEQLRRAVPGGIGTYARGLLGQLAPGGTATEPPIELELLASRQRRRERQRGADPLAAFRWPVRTNALPGRVLTRAWERGLVEAPRGFDVVHAVSLAFPRVPRRANGRRTSLVVTVHDLAWRSHPEATTARGRRWHEAGLDRALRRADALVTPSDQVAAALVAAGARPDAVSVIAWGADHLVGPDRSAAAALLAEHGVSGPYLLSVGTLEPRKNLARLFDAYARARRSFPEPWPLVVVGPAGWGRSTVGDAGRPGSQRADVPQDGVVLVGAVFPAVLAGLYAGARAFAYVPLLEGYGLPPLEAMQFGVPVVASTEVPSVTVQSVDPPSTAGAGPAALVVDPLSVSEIAEALVAAAGDEPLRRSLAARGAALTETRTWRRAASAHTRLWRRVT